MGLLSFLVTNRWLLAMWLLPASLVYDLFWFLRGQMVLYLGSAPRRHAERVERVQRQVIDWRVKGRGRKMCTARPQWMSISQQKINYKSKSYRVEVNLMDILEINAQERFVRVEPMVSIGRLMQALVPRGWMVPIVPEIGDLTVGGLVMGGGIESTSHKYGIWQHICTRYEVVVADGSVVVATKEQNSDLFYAIPWSYGTFGFLTAVDVMIVPYKPWVRLHYQPTYSLDETMSTFDRETKRETKGNSVTDADNDSVEGIMFDKDRGVVMTGTFVDDCERDKVNRLGRWYKPWFYTYVKKFLDSGPAVEYVPTMDFFFRHNKPFFWLTHVWVPFGNHPIFRYLFGYTLPYNYGLLKLINDKIMPKGLTNNFVTQDYGIPSKYLKEAIEFFHDEVEIYPLWLCPGRCLDTGPVKSMKCDDPIVIDVGIYGFCAKPDFDRVRTHKRMERFTMDHAGYQGLYAEVFLSYEEFNEMFDGSHYRKVRAALPLTEEAFPEVYEKVSKLGRSMD